MVPPGDLYYFYTVDDLNVLDKDDIIKINPEGILSNVPFHGSTINIDLAKLNYRKIKKNKLFNDYYDLED